MEFGLRNADDINVRMHLTNMNYKGDKNESDYSYRQCWKNERN